MKDQKEVVKLIKQTIKELQEEHKKNLKYRPYAQDIAYAIKKNQKAQIISTAEVQRILIEENIKIEQPKDPINDPQPAKLVATK